MVTRRIQSYLGGLAMTLCVAGSAWPQAAESKPAEVVMLPTRTAPATAPLASSPHDKKENGKKDKGYTGPQTVVELAPTPMLDSEGNQQLDPDAKPMFNPPVRQQRDKKGHPLFDEGGKPVMQTADQLGFDEKGKKLHAKKEKAPKPVSVAIVHGTLSVDGMTGKAGLSYEIADLKYIYLYAPWVGLTVVSNEMFPGAKEQPGAFDDKTLTVSVGEHYFQLYSDTRLLGKKSAPAFVLVDRDYKSPTTSPVMGYGALRKAPYVWPGMKDSGGAKTTAEAPPLPANMRATAALQACPSGQRRVPAAAAIANKQATASRCVAM